MHPTEMNGRTGVYNALPDLMRMQPTSPGRDFKFTLWVLSTTDVSFVFSAEIVLTQLWWDLLDPYVKQTKNQHTLLLSPISLPLFLALFTFLENILLAMIELCVSSVHCVLATFVLRSQPLCYLMSFWKGLLESPQLPIVCCFSLKTLGFFFEISH